MVEKENTGFPGDNYQRMWKHHITIYVNMVFQMLSQMRICGHLSKLFNY